MFENLAQELKAARESMQFTPEQMARTIKIDLKFLIKLEKGDFSFLPELYLKAFLRDYAKAVHLDEKIIMKKYQAARDGKPLDVVAPEPPVEEIKPQKNLPSEIDYTQPVNKPIKKYEEAKKPQMEFLKQFSDQQKQIILFASAAFVIICIVLYYAFFSSNGTEIVVDKPVEEMLAEAKKKYEEPAPAPVQTTSDSLSLRVQIVDNCWVQMVLDSSKVVENYYSSETTVNQKAKSSIKINIGNSAAVNLFLNDKPVDFTKQNKKSIRLLLDKRWR